MARFPLSISLPVLILLFSAETQAANRFMVDSPTVACGSTGVQVVVRADLDQDAYGLSVSLGFDRNRLRVTDVELGADVAATDPEWDGGKLDNSAGWLVHGVVFDLSGPNITKHLNPGTSLEILVVTLEVIASSPTSATLDLRDYSGSPARLNVITDENGDSVSPSPTLVDGAVICTELPRPRIDSVTDALSNPPSGPAGTIFFVSGANFDQPDLVVRVGQTEAENVIVFDATSLQATSPEMPDCSAINLDVEVCNVHGCDTASGAYECTAPEVRFDIDFAGPCGGTRAGSAEGLYAESADLTLETSDNPTGLGAQGWSLSLAADGLTIVDITTDGTVGAATTDNPPGLRNGGFEKSETTSGPGNEGAVSAIVLSFTLPITLDPVGMETVAKIDVEGTYPANGQTTPVRLYYVDGRQGSGQPVFNNVTLDNRNFVPVFGECRYNLRGSAVAANWVTFDNNDDGNMDISDAIYFLTFKFLGGPAPRCVPASDFNDDGRDDISDAISELQHLFLGGPPPPAGKGCQPYAGCPTSAACL